METITHSLKYVDLLRLSLRIFKTKPIRTFLTVLGMSVGIATVLFLVSLGYGLQYILIGKLVATEDSLITLEATFPSETERNITQADLEKIAAIPEAEEIATIAEFPGTIKYGDTTGLTLIRMVNPNYFRLAGLIPDIGLSIKDENETSTVLSSQAIKLISLPVDATSIKKEFNFKIFYQESNQVEAEEIQVATPLALKGLISDELQAPFAIVPLKAMPKEPAFFKKVLVKAQNINVIEKLRDQLIEQGYLISARIDLINQARKVMDIITVTLGIFGVAALIVSSIGMFNTMVVGFLERIYEVGILKSLGAGDKDVRNLFLMESLIMGLLGGLGGVILGISLGQTFNFFLNVLAARFGGKPFELFITPWWFVGLVMILSTFIGFISGFWPARRAAYLSPKEAFAKR